MGFNINFYIVNLIDGTVLQVQEELESSVLMLGKVVKTLQETGAAAMQQAALLTGMKPA